MQTHYISCAWFDTKGKITDVLIHLLNPAGTFQFGKKTALAQVINTIQHENIVVKTIIWNDINANWEIGPEVIISQNNFLEYVEKNPDKLKLQDLIKMNAVINT